MDDQDTKDRQLNAIVGGALRGLAESGADDEAIGAFARSYLPKVSKILGCPREALEPPDLTQIIQESVAQALANAGLKPARKSRKQNDRFTVNIAGQRTSITIQKTIVAQILEVKGNPKAVSSFVREVALDVPDAVENKSAWVEDRIATLLSFEAESAGVSTSARH
jgi:hypothetical protein